MSEAKVQIVSTHLRKSKNASSCFFLFLQVVSSQRLELKSRCTDQISKSIDQSIEPIDEPIPMNQCVCVCVCKGGIRRGSVIRGEKNMSYQNY